MKTIAQNILPLALACLPLAAPAASRSSLDYSIPADALDAGGQRVSSATYTLDASLGGLGTSTNAQLTNHASYPGQLVEVREVTVVAPGTNLNEGSSLPLSAVVRYDDGTYANVTGTGVRWETTAPLSASPLSPGLVTAGTVWQDTVALAEAHYLGSLGSLGLLVLDTQQDNYGIYAGDGLDDAWQVGNFGPANPEAAPDRDPDGDGQSNRYEFAVGTSPTDAASRFRLRIDPVIGRPTWKAVTFSPRLPDRTYTVEYRTNNSPGGFVTLQGQPITDAGSLRTVTDQTATNEARFYRVRITAP